MFSIGDWAWSTEHNEICRMVDHQTLWGETVYRVWIPNREAVVCIRHEHLLPISATSSTNSHQLTYLAAAAKVAEALNHDVLLAPIESSVIPLPHQVRALSRAISGKRVRYLLADEVGLGKTIEAGLILRELKLRGQVRRILIVAPKGLVKQWIAELRTHFNEEFRLLLPSEFVAYRSILGNDNPWRAFNQVVCSMDSVKPLDERRGWSAEQIAMYNHERFDDLVTAGWDLVIVDEAHRLAGSTDQVARYRLGRALADASPYFLLLSATPHQGKTDAFHRLMALLDPLTFPDTASIGRDRIHPFVIRTEKRHAIDADGQPLFKPRQTQLVPVHWFQHHQEQRSLYEAVTEYVREGYNQALKTKQRHIGFLMILMQRLVTSSTRAIRATLERRLNVLQTPAEFRNIQSSFDEEDWAELDGQEQIESLLSYNFKAQRNEFQEVQVLLETAFRVEQAGPDAKAEALLEMIYQIQQEETDPNLKVLIFTEFIPTQEMLYDFLTSRGFRAVRLNGSMDLEARKQAEDAFAAQYQILISTDAGGEGLNLQFCHVVVNYDMPWNPMRIEQRIGRVDRIGQTHIVRALNLALEDTVEHRIRSVLEEKLAVILNEFGVDKTGDVLDSAQAGQLFDSIYVEAILSSENLSPKVETLLQQVREQTRVAQETSRLLSEADQLDPREAKRLKDHPLPSWLESMTINYLRANGGKAEKDLFGWKLTWPTGETVDRVVFGLQDSEPSSGIHHLTLEDSRVRGLVMHSTRIVPGQPIPCLMIPNLPSEIQGIWSLWRISLFAANWNQQRIMPLFLHNDGRILQPTARHIWEQFLSANIQPHAWLTEQRAKTAYDQLQAVIQVAGKPVYESIKQEYQQWLKIERERVEYAFSSRRAAIERIGLPAVRGHRLSQLDQEERNWQLQIETATEIYPELIPIVMVCVEAT